MTENELIILWVQARWHIIISQLAPTFLLTALVGFLAMGLGETSLSIRIAAAGVLLASGVLGAIAQVSAANEGLAVATDLRDLQTTTAIGRRISASIPWINVVRIGTPAVFVVVYIALLTALFVPAS